VVDAVESITDNIYVDFIANFVLSWWDLYACSQIKRQCYL